MITMTATSVSPSTWNRFDAPVTEPPGFFAIRVFAIWFVLWLLTFAVVDGLLGQFSALSFGPAAVIAALVAGIFTLLQRGALRPFRLAGVPRVRQGAVLEVANEDIDVVVDRLRTSVGRFVVPNKEGELLAWSVPPDSFFRIRVRLAAPGILRLEGTPRWPWAIFDQGRVLHEVLRVVTWYEASRDGESVDPDRSAETA